MFLGAGSGVMHGMGGQVSMRRFGALRGAMKVTWLDLHDELSPSSAFRHSPAGRRTGSSRPPSAPTFGGSEATWIGF